jgi:hypothetical protein
MSKASLIKRSECEALSLAFSVDENTYRIKQNSFTKILENQFSEKR